MRLLTEDSPRTFVSANIKNIKSNNMKSKLLLLLMSCCLITAKVSAQCYTHFTYQQNPANTTVIFYTDSTNPGGGFLNNYVFNWSFGDGTAGSGSQVSHTYNANAGSYIVCLTMNDTVSHCTFTTCDTVRVSTGSGNTCSTYVTYNNTDSTFSFSAYSSGNGPITYTWTVDGQPLPGSGSTNTVVIPLNAYRNVCVTATDSAGCSSSDCALAFDNAQLSCNTYASYTNQDSLYTFTASHIGGNVISYSWTLNNSLLGTTSSVSTILDSTALGFGGTICVTTTDVNGCTSTDCITISSPSGGGGCQAYFVIYPDSANSPGGYYSGYNFSTGSYGSNVLWDFGDGSTSNSQYPTHTYATPGQYTVCLTVGALGTNCYDTYCDSSFYAFKTAGGLMSHLTISGPTGINEASANNALSIYPNPVNDKLTINTTAIIDNEKIYNINGQLVFERKSGTEINVSKLSAGIYILELSSGGALSRMKFVKN